MLDEVFPPMVPTIIGPHPLVVQRDAEELNGRADAQLITIPRVAVHAAQPGRERSLLRESDEAPADAQVSTETEQLSLISSDSGESETDSHVRSAEAEIRSSNRVEGLRGITRNSDDRSSTVMSPLPSRYIKRPRVVASLGH
jgi:hypothetical protein